MVNEQRLLNSFLDMVRIDSESYHEREIADKLALTSKRWAQRWWRTMPVTA